MAEQGTHKPLVGGSNPPFATREWLSDIAGMGQFLQDRKHATCIGWRPMFLKHLT